MKIMEREVLAGKKKKMIMTILLIMIVSSLCAGHSYAKSSAKSSIYQGYFMRGNTFISIALYTSGEGDALGVAYSIDRPKRTGTGVTANIKEHLGEIYKKNGSYYVKNGAQDMRLDFYQKSLSVSNNSSYKGRYVQISNQGANMSLQSVWLDIPDIRLNAEKVTLSKKETFTLKVNNYSGKVKWKSSNDKIASVSKSGKVRAKKAGTAVITAKGKGFTQKCRVVVKGEDKSKFKRYTGKAYCKSNAKFMYGVSFKKNNKVYVGIWNPSGTSSSYEDFYFELDKKKTKYTVKGMRSKTKYEVSIIPKGKNVLLKLKGRGNSYFDTKGITLRYDKKVTSAHNY